MFDKTAVQNQFKAQVDRCAEELAKIHTGRPRAESFEEINVFAYEMNQPIRNLALVNVPDFSTVTISPYDKSNLKAIEKGILEANLGFTPRVEGDKVYVSIPPMTEERRRKTVDEMYEMVEKRFKVAVRQARQDAMHAIDALKGTISEDIQKVYRNEVEEMTKNTNAELDKMAKTRENEIMNISGK